MRRTPSPVAMDPIEPSPWDMTYSSRSGSWPNPETDRAAMPKSMSSPDAPGPMSVPRILPSQ